MKTLVVYYTKTGNSKFAAETIAAEVGADMEEVVDLRTAKAYSLSYPLAETRCREN